MSWSCELALAPHHFVAQLTTPSPMQLAANNTLAWLQRYEPKHELANHHPNQLSQLPCQLPAGPPAPPGTPWLHTETPAAPNTRCGDA